jgi:hypothetical protein
MSNFVSYVETILLGQVPLHEANAFPAADVIPATPDWAAAPDAVSGNGVPALPERLTTADDATGHDVAVGTETGGFTTLAGCVFSTPKSLAATTKYSMRPSQRLAVGGS